MARRSGAAVFSLLWNNGIRQTRGMSSTASMLNGNHVTSKLSFIEPDSLPPISMYRVLTQDGHFIDPNDHPQIEEGIVLKMYRDMVRLNVLDQILYDCQRQGRITFYLTNFGEEGTQIGSAAALNKKDLIFGQYREAGVLMWRDFPMSQFFNQCYGNRLDWNKGRQMPVHYGSRDAGFVTISPTLGTQIPQAAGAAYSFKRKNNNLCVMALFGDGATSEGDTHAGFNFASVLNCPVIYVCRNNGYAISTPTEEQYKGDGIASRGVGYGMTSIRVDGNDIFAVYNATKEARKICVSENRPVLIEAMTYRIGHHSTSDDSSTYRSADEVKLWDSCENPVTRLRNYMTHQNLWDDEKEETLQMETRKEVMKAMVEAENEKKCNPDEMFGDVYDELPHNLKRQRDEMRRHLNLYKEQYKLNEFEGGDWMRA